MHETLTLFVAAIIFIVAIYSFKKDEINILPGKTPGEILVFNSNGHIATITSKTKVIWLSDTLDSWTVEEVLLIAMDYDNHIKNLYANK